MFFIFILLSIFITREKILRILICNFFLLFLLTFYVFHFHFTFNFYMPIEINHLGAKLHIGFIIFLFFTPYFLSSSIFFYSFLHLSVLLFISIYPLDCYIINIDIKYIVNINYINRKILYG